VEFLQGGCKGFHQIFGRSRMKPTVSVTITSLPGKRSLRLLGSGFSKADLPPPMVRVRLLSKVIFRRWCSPRSKSRIPLALRNRRRSLSAADLFELRFRRVIRSGRAFGDLQLCLSGPFPDAPVSLDMPCSSWRAWKKILELGQFHLDLPFPRDRSARKISG